MAKVGLTPEKISLIEQIQAEKEKQKRSILTTYIPGKPDATPFPAQILYYRDTCHSQLVRGGNRSSKTFSAMRNLSWMLTRSHPYRQEWCCLPHKKKNWKDLIGTKEHDLAYIATEPKVFWLIGPSYNFVQGVQWNEYVAKMVPEYYIKSVRYTNQKNLDSVQFRNGDTLVVRSYAQSEHMQMGFSVNCIFLDEMPNDFNLLSELRVRTFDKSGELHLCFTPLVVNTEIRDYLDKSCAEGTTSLHRWSVLDNPWYRDCPERLNEVLAEYSHLPENLRLSRLQGEWYSEILTGSVYEGVELDIIEDFEIPPDWRRCRFTDPAARVTGHAEFAEDPATGFWYCYKAQEITWGEAAAKAEDILREINRNKPHEGFVYSLSVYDNSELWFGAYAAKDSYVPCIEKNRDAAIIATRTALATGQVKLFKHGACLLVQQIQGYRFHKSESGKVVKKDDHALDALHYFCRQKPKPIAVNLDETLTEKQYICKKFNETKEAKRVAANQPGFRRTSGVQSLARRTRR